MALTHVTALTTLFGASATNDAVAHPNTEITFKPAELGTGSNVTDSAALTPEGIVLALLQFINDNQTTTGSPASARILEVTRSTPVITTRGGASVRGERYVVTVYSPASVSTLDPDDITY